MATYKYPDFIRQVYNYAFDIAIGPGELAQNSGIYRCDGCGREIVVGYEKSLPSQSHHRHKPGEGDIRWRLIVATEFSPSEG